MHHKHGSRSGALHNESSPKWLQVYNHDVEGPVSAFPLPIDAMMKQLTQLATDNVASGTKEGLPEGETRTLLPWAS